MDVQVSQHDDPSSLIHHDITRPEVQEPAPVTEDQLAELSEVILKHFGSVRSLRSRNALFVWS